MTPNEGGLPISIFATGWETDKRLAEQGGL